MAWYTINFNANGGTLHSASSLYYNSTGYYWATAKNTGANYRIFSIVLPTRNNFACSGFWTGTSGNGTEIVGTNGGLNGWVQNPFSSNPQTIYAGWRRVSWTVYLDTGAGITNNGTTEIFSAYQAGGFYSDDQCTAAISSITPPTRSGYVFAGYNTAADGSGGEVIDSSGVINEEFARQVLAHDVTIYAQWTPLYTITLNDTTGAGGQGAIYFKSGGTEFYSDLTATTAVSSVALPAMQHGMFLGYFTAEDGGDQRISESGEIAQGWTPTENVVLYAHWQTVLTVTMDVNGGIGGTPRLSYDYSTGEFFIIAGDSVSAVDIPSRICHRFVGYYSAAVDGVQVVDGNGAILPALSSMLTDDVTIYARWERVSYVALLVDDGMTVGAIYCDGTNADFYEDDQLTSPIDSVEMPSRPGYSATGFFTTTTGGVQVVSATGEIICGVISQDVEYYAQWSIKTYWLTFDPMGGTVSPQGKSVTWQTAIGILPTPTRPPDRADALFDGWYIDGVELENTTLWTFDADATARARWKTSFSDITDYFNLSSSALVPIASTAGDTRQRVTAAHGGKYESGVNEVGGIWRNPTVTYVVRANTTVAVKLGKAWPATFTGAGANRKMAVSGYMIVAVEINTEVGKFPTVTVSAVANEGANAVNNFTVNDNKFNISVPVVARSKAQNLLGAISGGGFLQRCALVATCDPVVCAENLMPCASDIVNGRYELTAETLAADNNGTPTMASASGANGGFALISAPSQERDCDYTRYAIQARKEMV